MIWRTLVAIGTLVFLITASVIALDWLHQALSEDWYAILVAIILSLLLAHVMYTD